MAAVILPIKAKYVGEIIRGDKTMEFRRTCIRRVLDEYVFEDQASTALIYETASTGWGGIVAEASIVGIVKDTPANLWKKYGWCSGMDEREFMAYYEGCEWGWAYDLACVEQYPEPVPLSYYGIKRAPQSFMYLPDQDGGAS